MATDLVSVISYPEILCFEVSLSQVPSQRHSFDLAGPSHEQFGFSQFFVDAAWVASHLDVNHTNPDGMASYPACRFLNDRSGFQFRIT